MPLPFPTGLADNEDGTMETFSVRVFRDHPEWERRERWWMMPSALLEELHVVTYEVSHPDHLDWVEHKHPDCVYVY